MVRGKIVLSLLGLVLGFQNCAKANFKTSDASLAYESCTKQLQSTSYPIKVLFVVDTSGSNAGMGGSDPTKAVRGGSINEFFTTYHARTNFSWAFTYFSGSMSTSLIGSAGNPSFTSNASAMQNAIGSFYGITDYGLTPYKAALQLARQALVNEAAASPANTKFVVVFLSDGVPDPVVDDATLRAEVQSIAAVRPGAVSFNTIYYGDADAVANARLKMMATVGAGQFLDTNARPNGKQFVISDVINVAGLNCGSAN